MEAPSQEAAPLCKCGECDQIFIDLNPQTDCEEYPCDGLIELELLGKGENSFYGCPTCKTDSFLQDSKL
ncbi:hypothetical protein SAMN05216327_101216 [Dyadobacter sp. SG02]|nr:hypothetical protein SAMN05216327_101216 [Dyadobacter sp. SG02]